MNESIRRSWTWVKDEEKRWVIATILKLVAIIAPFILVYLTVSVQWESNRKYEKSKLVQLVDHLEGEMLNNLQLVRDRRITPLGMRPSVVVDSTLQKRKVGAHFVTWTTHLTFIVSDIRFKTVIWQTANSKDYFFLIDRTAYYNLNAIYTAYQDYNSIMDKLAARRLAFLTFQQTSPYTGNENVFNFYLDDAQALVKNANSVIDQIESWGEHVSNYTQLELKSLRSSD